MATIGLIMGIAAPFAAIVTPISGYLLDNWNDKNVILIGLLSNLVAVLCIPFIGILFLFSFVDFFRRIGTSATSSGTRARILEILPPKRQGEGLSIFTTSHNLGTAMMPPIGILLLEIGNFNLVIIFSIALISLGIITTVLLNTPKDLAKSTRTAENNNPALSFVNLRKSIRLKSWIPPLILLIMVISFFGSLTFIPLLSIERSIDNYYQFFTVYGLTVLTSRLIVGRLSDRYGREPILIPCILLCSLAMIVLAFSYSLLSLLITAVLFGIGWGSAFPTLLNFASDLSFENTTGQTMSIMSASFSIGTALGGLIVGLLTQYFTFQVSFLFLAFSLIGAMLILSIDYKKRMSSH